MSLFFRSFTWLAISFQILKYVILLLIQESFLGHLLRAGSKLDTGQRAGERAATAPDLAERADESGGRTLQKEIHKHGERKVPVLLGMSNGGLKTV